KLECFLHRRLGLRPAKRDVDTAGCDDVVGESVRVVRQLFSGEGAVHRWKMRNHAEEPRSKVGRNDRRIACRDAIFALHLRSGPLDESFVVFGGSLRFEDEDVVTHAASLQRLAGFTLSGKPSAGLPPRPSGHSPACGPGSSTHSPASRPDAPASVEVENHAPPPAHRTDPRTSHGPRTAAPGTPESA